jgi:hypothetical protein
VAPTRRMTIFLRAFVGAEVVTRTKKKKRKKRDKGRKKKKKKRTNCTRSQELCAACTARPDPSVLLFDVSPIDAVRLGPSCLI